MSNHRVIIVHGTEGSPESNWFPWLTAQLQEGGIEVLCPQFPTPEGQSLESWMATFSEEVGELQQSDIVVGHSTGVIFLLHALQGASLPVKASFLVAGFVSPIDIEKYDRLNKSFLEAPLDWNRIRENGGAIHLYAGGDDPYVPLSCAVELEEMLRVTAHFIDGGGHLNSETGYTSFDLLLSDLLAIVSS
ncbi:MAG: alpha/beta hydrolase [Bdellovibrionales bacterium]|nr:alpha/beta hydrolase [Bdellovibrionales bacterium]